MTMDMTSKLQAVGRRLRRLREEQGLSRREVAEATDVSERSVVRLEAGDRVVTSSYFAVRDFLVPLEGGSEMVEALLRLDAGQLRALLLEEVEK